MGDNEAMAARFEAVLRSNDFGRLIELTKELATDDARDGRIARMTESFANPFEAPAWRADIVERMATTQA